MPTIIIMNGEKINLNNNANTIQLKKGKNHLILKMTYTVENVSFSFYLPDVKIENWKQKYKIIDFKQ